MLIGCCYDSSCVTRGEGPICDVRDVKANLECIHGWRDKNGIDGDTEYRVLSDEKETGEHVQNEARRKVNFTPYDPI